MFAAVAKLGSSQKFLLTRCLSSDWGKSHKASTSQRKPIFHMCWVILADQRHGESLVLWGEGVGRGAKGEKNFCSYRYPNSLQDMRGLD